jgi:hypothetical protein
MKSIAGGLFFSVLLPVAGVAQRQLTGKIRLMSTNEVLSGVTISNRRLDQHNISDLGGNYRIAAQPGDTLILSSASTLTDTLLVSADMFSATANGADGYVVHLHAKIVSLPSVKITEINNYQKDSIQRHEDYAWLLDKKHPIKLWNEKTPGDAPGLNFSPIDYYSKGEVRKRQLKKRLKQEEEDYYIDFKFPRARVAALTGLKGDSLQQFLVRYRPTYKWCRSANMGDVLLYINDKLVLFRKRT